MNQRKIYEWVETFKARRTNFYLTELDRGPRQRSALDDHIQSANALIQEDRRIIASEVAQMLGI
jgi:hypothetical protein